MNHRSNAADPVEETISTWHNPMSSDQTVIFHDTNSRGTKFVIPAGGVREIPGRYDFAIQRVQCGDNACRQSGHGFCMHGHDGQVIGGMAPGLIKQGQTRRSHPLDPALDPDIQLKREAEAKIAAAMIARSSADEALLIAKGAEIQADEKLASVAEKTEMAAPRNFGDPRAKGK